MTSYGKRYHRGHDRHYLQREYVKEAYTCKSCMEVGFGKRYSCPHKECDFHVHDFCVDPPSSVNHHFFKNIVFNFQYSKVHGWQCAFCIACGLEINGSSYHSASFSFYLHPFCVLTLENKISNGHVNLLLLKKLSSDCHFCGLQVLSNGRESWGYVSEEKKCQFHLYCVKKKVIENWENITFGVDLNHEFKGLLLSNINSVPDQSLQ